MELLALPLVRLAVLPMPDSSDPVGEEAYFCRGFVEDVITDLSRFAFLGLISPHSSFSGRFESMTDGEIAADLQCNLLLKSRVRKRGNEIRINAQLVDPESGSVLWAERYDAATAEVFALQDNLVEKVVAAISSRIDAITLDAARRKPITELEVYDCWLRGLEKLHEASAEADEQAREFFERALEIDPLCARAYAGLSLSHFNEWSCQNWELSEVSECRAFQYANRALQLDRSDAVAHLVAGRVHLFRSDFEKAAKHTDLAFELNPNDADHLVQIASCKAFLGDADLAWSLFERALMLNPYCDPWYFAYGGFVRIMQREFDEGIALALKAPLTTVWLDLCGFIAIAHAYRGEIEEAKVYRDIFLNAYREKILKGREPDRGEAVDWLTTVNPFQRREDSEFFREGLRLAGFTEPVDTQVVTPPPSKAEELAVFRLENNLRVMVYAGSCVQLPEVKGFKDIERLLGSGDEEIHCTGLLGAVSETGTADEAMDSRARAEYAARIRELQSELSEAEDSNDSGRAETIRAELDPLIDHLTKSMGLGGRSRKLAAPAERARSAVTWRIRSAIGKIEAVHPSLGRHFANSIRTGTFCSYAPEKPTTWSV